MVYLYQKGGDKVQKISFQLSDIQNDELRTMVEKTGKKLSEILREALGQYYIEFIKKEELKSGYANKTEL